MIVHDNEAEPAPLASQKVPARLVVRRLVISKRWGSFQTCKAMRTTDKLIVTVLLRHANLGSNYPISCYSAMHHSNKGTKEEHGDSIPLPSDVPPTLTRYSYGWAASNALVKVQPAGA